MINGLLFWSSVLVIMSTTHGCVSHENKTASFSYMCYVPQGTEQHHREHVQHLKVADLFLKVTVVILLLVNTYKGQNSWDLVAETPFTSICPSVVSYLSFWLFATGCCSEILSLCLEAAYLLPCIPHCYSNRCSVELCVLTEKTVLTFGLLL